MMSRRALAPVHAGLVHHHLLVGDVTLPTLPTRPIRTARRRAWRDGVGALLLAIGLSTTFISPFRYAKPAAVVPTGRILGESIVVPLHISVAVKHNGDDWRVTTYPSSGTVAEALAQAAGSAQASLEYVSRGSSIYLQRFMGRANDLAGHWVTRVNGEALTDLSLRQLIQGDEVSITWEAQ